jgi:hypothetical protein
VIDESWQLHTWQRNQDNAEVWGTSGGLRPEVIAALANPPISEPNEVGEVFAWLCSSSASDVNGTVVAVDGMLVSPADPGAGLSVRASQSAGRGWRPRRHAPRPG